LLNAAEMDELIRQNVVKKTRLPRRIHSEEPTSETLLEIVADPKHLGARIGVLAVLHTWSQNLRHHPHLHCLVPAGGLAFDISRWVATRRGFFLPVRVLSRMLAAERPKAITMGSFVEATRRTASLVLPGLGKNRRF
jgi:hypothetical protein